MLPAGPIVVFERDLNQATTAITPAIAGGLRAVPALVGIDKISCGLRFTDEATGKLQLSWINLAVLIAVEVRAKNRCQTFSIAVIQVFYDTGKPKTFMADLCNKASLPQRGIDKELGHGRIQRLKPLLRSLLSNAGGTLEVVEIHELTPQGVKVMSVLQGGDQAIR